jgi:hypothetical protein
MAGEEQDAGVRALIDVNGLSYKMTPGMSIATSRVKRQWDAMRPSYAENEIITIPISTGAAFVDPANSTVSFQLRINVTAAAASQYLWYWGNDTKRRQNALNLFSDMRIVHSSGYEVDRIVSRFGAWSYIKNSFSKPEAWHDTHGSLIRGTQTGCDVAAGDPQQFIGNDGGGGAFPEMTPDIADNYDPSLAEEWPEQFFPIAPAAANAFDNTAHLERRPFGALTAANLPNAGPFKITIDVEIPLSEFSGVWDTDMLAPSYLMAGARLELTVANREQVFVVRNQIPAAPASNVGWNITLVNVRADLETITFTDAALRSISMTSANTGLEIPFVGVHYALANANSSSVSIQINRAVSRANAVILRAYPQTAVANTPRTTQVDSVAAYYLPLSDGFQVKLGAEFMPSTPIKGPLQLYQAAQTAFGNWKSNFKNSVRAVDYYGRGGMGYQGAAPGNFCPWATLAVMAHTLEKSSTLAQSGSPISAARDLNVVFGGASYLAYTAPALWNAMMVDVFVPHISLVTVFLDSVLVRS